MSEMVISAGNNEGLADQDHNIRDLIELVLRKGSERLQTSIKYAEENDLLHDIDLLKIKNDEPKTIARLMTLPYFGEKSLQEMRELLSNLMCTKSNDNVEKTLDVNTTPQDLYSILSLVYPKASTQLLRGLKNAEKNHQLYNIDVHSLIGGDPLTYGRLRKLPNIGSKSLTELKSILVEICSKKDSYCINTNQNENNLLSFLSEDSAPNFPIKLSDISLHQGFFSPEQRKTFNKIENLFGKVNLHSFLSLTENNLIKVEGFGQLNLSVFKSIYDRIYAAFINVVDGGDFSTETLFIVAEYTDINLTDIDQILFEDVDQFLCALDPAESALATERWGLYAEKQTLEALGRKNGNVTKELIRQRMVKIEKTLVQSLRIPSHVLRENLLNQVHLDFKTVFVKLSSCFEREKHFIDFLETICGSKKNGEIWNLLHPYIPTKIIGPYFAENSSPIEIDKMASNLESEYGYEKNIAANAIKDWVNSGLLRVAGSSVSPLKLGKIEAAAHILLDHPNGLPWGDITNLVNKSGCSRTRFDENRMDQSYDSEYVYLCGRGTYKHQKYLTITEAETKLIINNLLEYFDQKDGAPIHLNEFYRHASDKIKVIDYNDLRHVIRSIGETYGIFFNGKSGADSVGLEPNFKRVDQQQVILNAMNHEGAMTISEIAERLRSKSTGHAGFYLDKMMAEDLVVKIDSMMYTTPEKAFKDINCEEILKLIDETIKGAGKIVEVDFLRIKINDQLGLSYSKHWYGALASINLKNYGWFKKADSTSKCITT